jgi:hypothetical protein
MARTVEETALRKARWYEKPRRGKAINRNAKGIRLPRTGAVI